MKTIQMEIDGKKIEAAEGTTVLEAARANGIHIPTLCYDERLKPYGSCRVCMVEIGTGDKAWPVASCVYPVKEGLVVRTDTEKIRRIRRMIAELLWPSAPALAKEYGIERSRFVPEQTECFLCGLCMRYCSEIKGKNVLYFKGRGIDRKVAIIPGQEDECVYCRECFNLCRGGLIVNQCDDAYKTRL